MEIGIKKARDQFSRLLQRVMAGEEVTITRKRKPIARLVGVPPKPGPRRLGTDRGQIWIADDFDTPMFLVEDRPRKKRKKGFSHS